MKKILLVTALLAAPLAHAQPPFVEPIDTNVVNTPDVVIANGPLEAVPVEIVNNEAESADDRFIQRFTDGTNCGPNGCLFATAGGIFDVPQGKTVLIETVTITYDVGSVAGNFVPATASFQTFSPFQRYMVGEMLQVAYTGAIGMATANLSLYANEITAVVTFPDVKPAAGTAVGVTVYVSGRLIDAPTP